jgi:hypothetical protein
LANKLQIKRTAISGRTPNTTNSGNTQYISAGELALNLTDGVLYSSDGSNLLVLTPSVSNFVNTSQLSSNLANYQTTAGLSANVATLSANNASYLGTVAAANYLQNSGAYTISGVRTHNSNIVFGSTAGIVANGSIGTANQVLTSNGSSVYWANVASGGATITVSDTAPSSPANGALWYYSSDAQLYIYYNDGDSAQWVTASGGGGINNANNSNYANNASYFGGFAPSNYVNTGYLSSQLSSYAPKVNPTFTGNVAISGNVSITGNTSIALLLANSSSGTAGFVLTSGGSSGNIYWAQASSGANVDYGLVTGSVTGTADYGSVV